MNGRERLTEAIEYYARKRDQSQFPSTALFYGQAVKWLVKARAIAFDGAPLPGQ